MGKQINVYKQCKDKNNQVNYLFKSGIFYYFLDEDAKYISNKYGFKLVPFGKTVKCGFQVKNLEKYLFIFNNEKIELVNDEQDNNNKIISILEKLDLNEITPHDAYIILSQIKELV